MDAGWAAVIVGILAIVVAFMIYFLQRNRKQISYQIISDTTVLNVEEGKEVKVEFRFYWIPSP